MNESILAELFGGVARFRALRSLFSEPGRGFGQRELAAEAGIDPGNVARLLKRWAAIGLVQRRRQDGLPRYYASTDPSLAALATLMQQDSQLIGTLREALSAVAGIKVAVVFGSVAGERTHAGSDIDVLVLGSTSELKLNAALKPAGRMLGRPVHATAFAIDSFRNQLRAGESFAQGVVQGPRMSLIGDFDAEILQATGR